MQHRRWTVLTYLFGLLPLCLIWSGNNAFYLDWKNHLWLIGYFGEYFRQHWAFPIVLNTEQVAGMPYPVFYGYLFYPAAGLISSITGAFLAMNLVCTLVFLLQVQQVRKTVEALAGNRFFALAVTVLVSFATYPLTNLYNRAAIPEFVAVSLVISVCMMWLRIVRMKDIVRRRRLVCGAALVLAFAMGTHPITAILGGVAVGLMIIATLRDRELVKTLCVAAALIVLVIAPWAYVMAGYSQKVEVAGGGAFLIRSLDRFSTRFFPLPWDPRMGTPELDRLGTPYLDTQINFALLVLALYLLYRALRQEEVRASREFRFALASSAGFLLVCVAFLSTSFWKWIPAPLKFIQFTYRLVSYADLFLLFTVLFLFACLRRNQPEKPLVAVLAVCLTLASASLTVKLQHANKVKEPNTLAESNALLSLAPSFYGTTAYAVKSGSRGMMPENTAVAPMVFLLGKDEHFGEVVPQPFPPGGPGLIQSNVQIFPWNRLVWNGREIPFAETATNSRLLTIAERTPGAGTLDYVLRPDPVWMVLRTISLWTVALWLIGFLCWSLRR